MKNLLLCADPLGYMETNQIQTMKGSELISHWRKRTYQRCPLGKMLSDTISQLWTKTYVRQNDSLASPLTNLCHNIKEIWKIEINYFCWNEQFILRQHNRIPDSNLIGMGRKKKSTIRRILTTKNFICRLNEDNLRIQDLHSNIRKLMYHTACIRQANKTLIEPLINEIKGKLEDKKENNELMIEIAEFGMKIIKYYSYQNNDKILFNSSNTMIKYYSIHPTLENQYKI